MHVYRPLGEAGRLLSTDQARRVWLTTVGQRSTRIARMAPGDFFGEIAVIDGGPRTATVTTAEPSRCLVLGPRQFQNVLHQDTSIAHSVMKALTLRVREAGAPRAD